MRVFNYIYKPLMTTRVIESARTALTLYPLTWMGFKATAQKYDDKARQNYATMVYGLCLQAIM